MAMLGGVGAGGSGGGDEPWGSRAGNGNCNENGKPAVVRERENERRRERRRRVIVLRILAALRENGNYTLPKNYDKNNLLMAVYKGPNKKPPAGDQQMADIGGSSAPVNPGRRASYGLTRPPSPSGITLGSRGSGGADPVPAWLKNLSKQLSDKSYPNFFASSSNDAAEDGSPPTSPPRRRKMARYSSPPPPAPPSSPTRASSNVLPPAATPSRPSPPLMNRLRFSFRRSDGEQAASVREEKEEVMPEKNADEEEEEEGVELTLGNVEIRKDRA